VLKKKLFHLTNPFFQELRSKECVGRVNGDIKENTSASKSISLKLLFLRKKPDLTLTT